MALPHFPGLSNPTIGQMKTDFVFNRTHPKEVVQRIIESISNRQMMEGGYQNLKIQDYQGFIMKMMDNLEFFHSNTPIILSQTKDVKGDLHNRKTDTVAIVRQDLDDIITGIKNLPRGLDEVYVIYSLNMFQMADPTSMNPSYSYEIRGCYVKDYDSMIISNEYKMKSRRDKIKNILEDGGE